jgi:serine phosphatase RsbU (regulator of sigma subunit)
MLLAIVLPVGAVAVTRTIDVPFPATLTVLSVVLATAVGRLAAGIVASLVAGALLSYYYVEPTGQLWHGTWGAFVGLLPFFLTAVITSALLSRATSAHEAAELARREAATARRAEEMSRQRLDALSAASRALAVSFDVEDNLARAAQLGIRYLGDEARIFVPDGRGGLSVVATAHRTGTGERVPVEAALDGATARAYKTGRPQTRSSALDHPPDGGPPTRELALPLVIGRRTLGVLSVIRSSEPAPYSEDEIAFAEELARRMARAIENARLYHERDQIATVLQQSLLPGALPEIPGLVLAARYEAAGDAYEVGGDFYDLIDLGPSSWLFVVGDVCGKGPEAAAVMGFARASIRAAAQKDEDPLTIVSTLNQALISRGWDRFVTMASVRIDRDEAGFRARCAVAGHPRPVVIPRVGDPVALGIHGTLLGVFPDLEVEPAQVRLGPGDAIVLYTDGLEGVDRSAEDVVIQGARRGTSDPVDARSIVRSLEEIRRASPRAAADDLAILAVSVPA